MSDALFYIFDGINPEPWEAPQASTGSKNKKRFLQFHSTPKQRTYQEALREVGAELLLEQPFTLNPPYEVRFFFWRDTTGGAMRADATNLQKATEDALQGLMYSNDRYNPAVSSVIIDQGPEVDCGLLVVIGEYDATPYEWASDRLAAYRESVRIPRGRVRIDDQLF